MFVLLLREAVKACLTELCIYLNTDLTPIENHPCHSIAFSGCWPCLSMHKGIAKQGEQSYISEQRNSLVFQLCSKEQDIVNIPVYKITLRCS